jgi:hypothetical protein
MPIRDALGMAISTYSFKKATDVIGKLYLTETIDHCKELVIVSRYYLATRNINHKFYIYNELYILNRRRNTEIGFSNMDVELTSHIYIKGKRLSDIVADNLYKVFDTLYV